MLKRQLLNKESFLIILSLIFFFTLLLPFYSFATIPQKPLENVYIFDYANLIDDSDENNMKLLAKEIEDRTSAEIVVVTVETLGDYTIDEYALQLFRKWGIGDKEKNNGVLILVNKENLLKNRKGRIRIEVGYGLEGAISDGKAGRILDTYAIPAFEKKEYSNGIRDTFFAVANEVAKEYNLSLEEIKKHSNIQIPADYNVEYDYDTGMEASDVVSFIVVLIVFIYILLRLRKRGIWHNNNHWGGFGGFGGGGSSGGGFGGFGGGSSGGGGASR